MIIMPYMNRRDSSESRATAYIDACQVSYASTRFVLLVLLTAAVLTFGAFWNGRSGSWVNWSIRRAKQVSELWDLKDSHREPTSVRDLPDFSTLHMQADLLEYYQRRFKSRPDLESWIHQLESDAREWERIKIPFFDLTIDVRDLGLYSGVGFTLLLI
jgi:hypothetical protein